MSQQAYAIGQAVYVRTDTPDFLEETVPFRTLEELVQTCSEPRPNMVLDKVVIFAMSNGEPVAVTLGFVSATKGQRPGSAEMASDH